VIWAIAGSAAVPETTYASYVETVVDAGEDDRDPTGRASPL
jgi:hypothetical protein